MYGTYGVHSGSPSGAFFFQASLATAYSPIILLSEAISFLCVLVCLEALEPSNELRPPSRNFSFHTYTVRGTRLCSRHISAMLICGLNVWSTNGFSRLYSIVTFCLSCCVCPPIVKVCIDDRSYSSGVRTKYHHIQKNTHTKNPFYIIDNLPT